MFEQMFSGLKRSIDTFKRPSFQINSFSSGDRLSSHESLSLRSGEFQEFFWNKKHDSILSISKSGTAFLKLGFKKNPKKLNSLKEEAEIIRFLNSKGAVTCPAFMEDGELDGTTLKKMFGAETELDTSVKYYFFVQECVPTAKKAFFADVILSVLEQKALGIYHGDIKPENIRFNESKGVCYLIDYDQAIRLSPEGTKYSNDDFFSWVDKKQKEMFGFDSWLRHFKGISRKDFGSFFEKGSFNLVHTSVYWNQRTTNTKNGVYHTISTPEVFAQGVRDLSDRRKVLDQMSFEKNEKTLDIGCNVGLLSYYLAKRGCDATGFELDPSIVWAARILNNIWGEKVRFECFDLDAGIFVDKFDTIMLFSVSITPKIFMRMVKKLQTPAIALLLNAD